MAQISESALETALIGVEFESERDFFFASIAISLKRIADAITDPDQYSNPIANAIHNGISQGAQDWIGHMIRHDR